MNIDEEMTMLFRVRMAAHSAVLLLSLLAAPRESHAQLAESARIAVGAPVWVRTRDGGHYKSLRFSHR